VADLLLQIQVLGQEFLGIAREDLLHYFKDWLLKRDEFDPKRTNQEVVSGLEVDRWDEACPDKYLDVSQVAFLCLFKFKCDGRLLSFEQ